MSFRGNDKIQTKRWPGLMGRSLKSDGRLDGRKMGESDLVGCRGSGQAASETSLFYQQWTLGRQ